MDAVFSLQFAGLVSGLVLGALLLIAAMALGLWLGRRIDSAEFQRRLPQEQVVRSLGGLYQWSSGMASEVEEYRREIDTLAGQMSAMTQAQPDLDSDSAVGLLTQIVEANERLQERLDRAESTLQAQAEEVASYLSESRTDPLTGLPNRRTFDNAIAQALAEWRRYGVPFSVLLVDVDFFKKLNDSLGHLAGDAVLVGLGRTLKETLRDCDLASRFGGEEFAILLPHTSAAEGRRAAERVRCAVESARFVFEEERIAITVSCGVAQALAGDETAALIKRSDEALYAAKRSGRNRACWHSGEAIVPIPAGENEGEHSVQDVSSEGRVDQSVASSTAPLTTLDRLCRDLRRRLLEVTAS